MFSLVLAPRNELQVGQPIVELIPIGVVDKLSGLETAPKALRDDEAVLIDPPSLVGHRQERRVQRHHDLCVAIGRNVPPTLPAGMIFSAAPTRRVLGTMLGSARMAALALRLAVSQKDLALLAATET